MRRIVVAAAAAAVVVLASLTGPARAAGHSETYTYIAGPGDLTSLNCDGGLKVIEEGIGGLCFDVLRGDTSVSLSVEDASGLPTSVTYTFRNAAGTTLGGYLQFCGSIEALEIPATAATLVTYVDTALAATSPCGGAPATTGTITAAFS